MKKDEFLLLVEKYKDNQCTPDEKKQVELFFETMQKRGEDPFLDNKGRALFQLIKYKAGIKRSTRRLSQIAKMAAVVVLLMGLAFTFNFTHSQNKQITMIAAKGERKTLTLEDGSTVVLNSNSSLTYPESFGKTREIKLNGEAYFKVFPNKSKPFVITTHDVNVEVLGTSFNVKSYKDHETKVSVVSGKVQITSPSGVKQLLVKNQQATYTPSEKFQFSQEDSAEGIAWTENTIFLKNTTLAETAKIIENWYNVEIDFGDKDIESLMISGKFKEEKLENVLSSIAALKQLEIEFLTKKQILIRKKRQLT